MPLTSLYRSIRVSDRPCGRPFYRKGPPVPDGTWGGDVEHREPIQVADSPGSPFARVDLWCAAAIAAAGVLVYLNSFAGVFIYDDLREIVESRRIRDLAGVWGNRPLVALSLALNFRFGGLDPWGYHLVNLVVHVLAGLTLFGVVRRTLRLERFGERLRRGASWYALTVGLVWTVHPLQTESVTYVIQRAESMMGLFYLLTIYCLIRGSGASRPWPWYAAGIAACLLGMASKPVMVTAPLVAILYDRVFLSGSLAEVFRRRWGVYAGLCGTWLLLVVTGTLGAIVASDPGRPVTAGFGYDGATPLAYALTQPGVLLHYAWLVVWPHPLCLDYDWPIARSFSAVAGPGLIIVVVLAASVWSFRRRSWLGFLGVSFFVILAPTSSIVPFAHAAFEHRMYLPLAALIASLVIGADALLARWYGRLAVSPVVAWRVNAGFVLAVVATLGVLTMQRNRDYHSAYRMWADVMVHRPLNPRPYTEIANIVFEQGQTEPAIELYQHAIRLDPGDHLAHDNLAAVFLQVGSTAEAIEHARAAVTLRPDNHRARCTLANALIAGGDLQEGLPHLYEAVRLRPHDPWSQSNLGRGLALEAEQLAEQDAGEAGRKLDQAVEHLVEAIRLEPDLPQAVNYLAFVLSRHGRIDETIARYGDVQLDTAHALAWLLRGELSYREGRLDDAVSNYRRALAIDPTHMAARDRLESVSRSAAVSVIAPE